MSTTTKNDGSRPEVPGEVSGEAESVPDLNELIEELSQCVNNLRDRLSRARVVDEDDDAGDEDDDAANLGPAMVQPDTNAAPMTADTDGDDGADDDDANRNILCGAPLQVIISSHDLDVQHAEFTPVVPAAEVTRFCDSIRTVSAAFTERYSGALRAADASDDHNMGEDGAAEIPESDTKSP